jgi:hypothetical protein
LYIHSDKLVATPTEVICDEAVFSFALIVISLGIIAMVAIPTGEIHKFEKTPFKESCYLFTRDTIRHFSPCLPMTWQDVPDNFEKIH